MITVREKLAEEYVLSISPNSNPLRFNLQEMEAQDGFLAGFDKREELLREQLLKYYEMGLISQSILFELLEDNNGDR